MSDNLATHFHLRVRHVYEKYLDVKTAGITGQRWDITAATDAAKALYHLREHLPLHYSKTWSYVVKKCPDYALLGDVANADKHRTLRKPRRGRKPAIRDISQIEERIVITEYRDERGTYRHAEKGVFLKLTNGSEGNLLDVLTNVINFWLDELHSLGVIDKLPHYILSSRTQPIPREECNDGRIDFRILAGIDYTQAYQLRQYNYSTGQLEPVDTSGADFRFSVYKPRYDLDIVFTKDTTGQKVARTVSLDELEYNMVKSLPTDQEKNRYFMTLPQVGAAYPEIVQEIKGSEPSP